MDPTAHRRKVHQTISSDSLADLYPIDINLYDTPPGNTISLPEFEDIALERIQLFRILEEAGLKGHKPNSEDWRNCVKQDVAKAGLKKFLRLMSGYGGTHDLDYEARRVDHISHFILRIAYCRSEELRRWFLNRELEWFRIKFMAQTSEAIKRFLQFYNLTYTPIRSEEKNLLRAQLACSTVGLSELTIESTEFYKVKFTEVCSLVKNRRVFLSKGFAYVPASELVVCIQSIFRARLSEALNVSSLKVVYCCRLFYAVIIIQSLNF